MLSVGPNSSNSKLKLKLSYNLSRLVMWSFSKCLENNEILILHTVLLARRQSKTEEWSAVVHKKKVFKCKKLHSSRFKNTICILSTRLWLLAVQSYLLGLPWSILHLQAFLCSCNLKRRYKLYITAPLRFERCSIGCVWSLFMYYGHVLWNIVSFDLSFGPRPDLWAHHAIFEGGNIAWRTCTNGKGLLDSGQQQRLTFVNNKV